MRGLSASAVTFLAWLPALAIGALQMARIDAGPLTDWGADVFGPIALYVSLRTRSTAVGSITKDPPSPMLSAGIVLAGCFAWELLQLLDLEGTPLAITKGRFDPVDLVAYMIGTAAALGGEAYFRRS